MKKDEDQLPCRISFSASIRNPVMDFQTQTRAVLPQLSVLRECIQPRIYDSMTLHVIEPVVRF